jgi:hypothetical protein
MAAATNFFAKLLHQQVVVQKEMLQHADAGMMQ